MYKASNPVLFWFVRAGVLDERATIKPDLQLIVDPSGRDDIDDAWVFTVRLELSL